MGTDGLPEEDERYLRDFGGVESNGAAQDDGSLYEEVVAESEARFAAHSQMPLDDIAAVLGVSVEHLTEILGERSAWDASWIMATPQRDLADEEGDRTPLQFLAAGGDREEVLAILADDWGW
jgi:hypothetical protein